MNLFRQRHLVLIALAVVSLVVVEAFVIIGGRLADEALDLRRHTHETLIAIGEINERKDQTESLVRDYARSGTESFAARAERAITEIQTRLAHARQLMGDDTNQVRRLTRLGATLKELTDRFTLTIETRRTSGAEAATRLVAEGTGRRLADEAEFLLDEMKAEENRLLIERSARAARYNSLCNRSAEVGGALVVLFGFLALRELKRQSRERAAAFEQIDQLRRHSELLFTSVADGLHGLDLDGSINFENPASERMLGYAKGELLGRPAHATIHHHHADGSDYPVASCPIYATLRDGQTRTVRDEIFWRKDGSSFPVEYVVSPITDGNAQRIGAIVAFRDVTERLRIEGELRVRESRFRALVAASARMIWRASAEGLISEPIPDWEKFVGQPAGESVKNNWGEFIHPDDLARLQTEFCQGTAGTKTFTMEFRARRHDGVNRDVVSLAAPVLNLDGSVREWIGSLNDVTEKKEAESALRRAHDDLSRANAELAQASKHKDEFLANMSHELRTPLNGILGFSEILEDQTFGPLNPRQSRYVGNVLSSGRHLLQLINDILDLAKIESGRLELHREDVPPARAIEDVLVIVKAIAGKKSILLRNECAADLPLLHADPAKFKQVLYNLLSNAVKFTPDGGTVTVRAEVIARPEGSGGWGLGDGAEPETQDPRPKTQSAIRISVSDTGIGIKPADHERLFKEFEQLDTTYGRKQQGTGLGLALTKKLVELHGGRIRVESEGVEGRGTTFHVELPLKSAAAPGRAEPLLVPLPEISGEMTFVQSGGARPLVLVVEDDPQAAGILYAYLLSSGYDVAHARTGDEALRLAGELKPFAITLDILMPGKTGWEVLAELKMNPGTRDIPVIIVSITDDKQLGFSLGAVDFIVKPVARERLIEAIRKAGEFAKRRIHTVLIVDDEPKVVEALAAQVRAAGFKVFEALSGRQALDLAVDKLPDLMILDLLMPGVNGFEVLDSLRANPLTFQMPVLIHTAKDLTNEERAQLTRQAQGITHKGAAAGLLAELQRLAEKKPEPPPGPDGI